MNLPLGDIPDGIVTLKDANEILNRALLDDVNHPGHYTLGNIEVYDFIKAWELSFAEGNVVKYVVRAPHKGTELKDLKKARWYLDQLIAAAEERL